MSFISVDEVLLQIREVSGSTDIEYINMIIPVAEETVFNIINRYSSGFTGTTLPASIKHAMLYLAADLYEFRETQSRYTVNRVPDTVNRLLFNHINYNDTY